jgi:uncharacterized membrane protein
MLGRTPSGRNRIALVALLLAPVLALALGAILFPREVWDGFLYRYFWGPVVSDSQDRTVQGIAEGYNVVSTITYALLLGLAAMAMYWATRRLRLQVPFALLLASVPLFLFGGVARSLEDAELFSGWVQFLFISPLIYVLVALIFMAAVAVGLVIERRQKARSRQRHMATFGMLIVSMEAAYFAVTVTSPSMFATVLNPAVPIAMGILSFLVFTLLTGWGAAWVPSSVAATGLFCLGMASVAALSFATDPSWQSLFTARAGAPPDPHSLEILLIPVIALGLTFLIWAAGHMWRKGIVLLMAAPVSLMMFASHFLDGAATYRGIDLYAYSEKHVLPSFLVDITGSAVELLLVKFLAILAIIIVIDVLFREELKGHPGLGNVIKFVVVFLGLAPGTRDALRIALGV